MPAPRRRLVRPTRASPGQPPPHVLKLRARLDKEQLALTRWQKRLKRAFNTVAKHQQSIARLERQLARLEAP